MKDEGTHSLTRAADVFDAWQARVARGSAEPYEEFLAAHAELRAELEALRRAEEGLNAFRRPSSSIPAAAHDSGRTRRANGGHLAPGDALGDFRIVRELGRGGMGIVFEAEQISLHRRVALKILPAQLTLNHQALERFQREAEITGRLKHRGIVDIHQVGEHDGIHFIVMELVEGASLDRVIDRMRGESFERVRKVRIADIVSAHGLEDAAETKTEPRPPSGEHGSKSRKASSSASNKNYIESSVRLLCQVADALDHAHKAGVIHRDIKPANILVRGDGTPVLTDFGLARESGLPGITVTGAFAGTPNYLSPEQAMSGRVPVDHRSDVFSLGATLYELVTLHYAFEGKSLHEVLSRILSKPPIPPQKHNPALAPDLVTILEKALEKDPDRRYQSAAELAEDLRAFIEYRPIRAKRTATVVRALRWVRREPLKAVLGIVLVLGATGGSVLWRSEARARSENEVTRVLLGKAQLPEKLGEGFLRMGVGEPAEAERAFAEVLAQDPDSHEAAAGLAMSLFAQRKPAEARQAIEAYETRHPDSLGRLRAEALRALGDKAAAEDLEKAMPEPRTPGDKYLEGMRLICGHPFVSGLPTDSLRPLLGTRGGPFDLRQEGSRDVFVEYRQNALEAISLLSDAAVDEPRTTYHFALAWAAWIAGDAPIARRYSESISMKWQENPVARLYAALAREVYDPQGALEAYADLLKSAPHLWMAHQRRAELFFQQHDTALALAEMRAIVASDPERIAFRTALAKLLLFDGQFDEAGRVAREVLEEKPDADANDVHGLVLYEQGDKKLARECFERAVALDDQRATFESHLGFVLLESDPDRALEHLERAAQLDPTDPFVAYNLGIAYHRTDEHGAALEQLDHALELVRSTPNPWLPEHQMLGARGKELVDLGRPEEAIESLHEAIRRAPPDYAEHYAVLGDAAEKAGRDDECLDARERLLQLVVDSDSNHAALAEALKKKGYMARAFAAALRWTEAHPSSARAWNERAWLQSDPGIVPPLGDPQDALRCAEHALQLEPENFGFLDTLACAQFANGLRDEAIASATKALDLAPEYGVSAADQSAIEDHLILFEADR